MEPRQALGRQRMAGLGAAGAAAEVRPGAAGVAAEG